MATLLAQQEVTPFSFFHRTRDGSDSSTSRKTFYNRQKFAADPSNCIGSGGGHLNSFLQIIDDNGMFRGWVGVEASLYGQEFGKAIVGIYDLSDF